MSDTINTFDAKIDIFMERHVIPDFDPKDILWWFSVSGGKDSFAMVHGIHRWYERKGINAESIVFHVNQWNPQIKKRIFDQFRDYCCRIIDGSKLTKSLINYKYGEQAPCRQCSDIRRKLNDELIHGESLTNNKINLLCKGLHLSDIAVSLLWRYAIKSNPFGDIVKAKKGFPITKLWKNTYLAKPLSYVREYEAQNYSKLHSFEPVCCGCPACNFPSRRDIVEESLLHFNRSSLWEFKIPGVNKLLNHWGEDEVADFVKALSSPGLETKNEHLPQGFNIFAVDYFKNRLRGKFTRTDKELIDHSVTLDAIGRHRLEKYGSLVNLKKIPLPTFFSNDKAIGDLESIMIGTLGPFWGAIGLSPTLSSKAFQLQNKYFDFTIDENWNQVTQVLIEYYRRSNVYRPQTKGISVFDTNNSSFCICNY